jgi:hypothetical protein
MKFSVYYRILNRDLYFDKFFAKESNKYKNDEDKSIAEDMYRDLLEVMVSYILTNNRLALASMLTKPNSKIAKRFFDYLTCSDTVHMNRVAVIDRINVFFDEVIINEDNSGILTGKSETCEL